MASADPSPNPPNTTTVTGSSRKRSVATAMSAPDADARDAARRRLLREHREDAIARAARAPIADVLRDHALVHLPPSAAARLRLVHPSWARALSSPLFAVTHAATPRRASGLFVVAAPPSTSAAEGFHSFLPLEATDTVPSPSLAFLPTSSPPAVLSSSHGVACCFSPTDDAYFVCNPATGSWASVPCPPCRVTTRPAVVVVFDAGVYNFSGDFTLVCAFEPAPSSGIYCFAVFSSHTGAWWVADAVALAEGLVPASGVAAGGVAWRRTAIGTAVGYDAVAGRVHMAVCPGDSNQWEIGSVAGTLHCAVRVDDEVVVLRRNGDGGWEPAAAVSVAEILDRRYWQPPPAYDSDSVEEAAEQDRTGSIVTAAAAARRGRIRVARDEVRLLPFQGAEVEVVVQAGRSVVAFEAVTRRRREVLLPEETDGTDWGAAVYVAHTNTLAMVAPVVLMEPPPDDQEEEGAS